MQKQLCRRWRGPLAAGLHSGLFCDWLWTRTDLLATVMWNRACQLFHYVSTQSTGRQWGWGEGGCSFIVSFLFSFFFFFYLKWVSHRSDSGWKECFPSENQVVRYIHRLLFVRIVSFTSLYYLSIHPFSPPPSAYTRGLRVYSLGLTGFSSSRVASTQIKPKTTWGSENWKPNLLSQF